MATETEGDRESLATAIGLYALGDLSLGEAAERAGVSRFRMHEALTEAGIDAALGGAESVEDVRSDAESLRDGE
jgi:predicted HTH domain antitoxin